MTESSGHRVSVVVVTHNSSACIHHCLDALALQTEKPGCIVIVDSGSDNADYLEPYRVKNGIKVIEAENVGYGAANNIGLSHIDNDSDYFLILNPDTFLDDNFLEHAIEFSEKAGDGAIITGLLESYNLGEHRPSGRIDSTGIFRKWYGRWYDRGHGKEAAASIIPDAGVVPAVCGALMFCRRSFFVDQLPDLFDERFFLFKEDIELSLRVRKKGGKLYYTPSLKAYHCRGWDHVRDNVSRHHRLMSSYNEMLLYKIHPSPYMLWAVAKYLVVKAFNL